MNLLYGICVVLLILWLLGLGTGFYAGGALHLLLVVVVILVAVSLLTGRKIE